MTIRWIVGRTGTGKTEWVKQSVIEQLKQDPLGDPIIVIVPDQLSYSMERGLTIEAGLGGVARAEVLTFKRLAWRILQQEGGITRKEIDPFGYTMLIRSILEEEKEQLQLFQKAANAFGFTELVARMMQEFERYAIDVPKLEQLIVYLKESGASPTTIQKMEDLYRIATKMAERLGTTYIDREGYLRLLEEVIASSSYVRKASIYIDGFQSFTEREYLIIEQLLLQAKEVVCTIPLDPFHETSDLFYDGAIMYDRLQLLVETNGLPLDEVIRLTESKRFQSEDLRHIERQYDRYPADVKQQSTDFTFIEAANYEAEIDAVARQIVHHVNNGYRYREIVVMYREHAHYDELFERRFTHYGIPYFLSVKKPMLHHPLIELVRSMMEAVVKNLTYEPMFRAIKTDLLFPKEASVAQWRERADLLENFVLERGIVGSKWFPPNDETAIDWWEVRRYQGLYFTEVRQTEEEIEREQLLKETRDVILHPFQSLANRLKKAKTGRAIAEALYVTIEESEAYEKLLQLQREEEEAGLLEKASEHEQAWEAWTHILDQFVLLFGEEEMTVKEAVTILDEGFESLHFRHIPPSIDQVTITTLEIASVSNEPIVFVVGVNDGVLPKRTNYEGLLSDREREFLEEANVRLAPTTKEQLRSEQFVAYRAFTAPSEKLYVSYALADEEGKALLPSIYVKRLRDLFVDVPVLYGANSINDVKEEEEPLYIVTPRTSLTYFIQKWKACNESVEEMPPIWQALYRYYDEHPSYREMIRRIVQPLRTRHEQQSLSKEATEQLYSNELRASISRIESFYNCAFQHYARYGLRLEERVRYELKPLDLGNLFHDALEFVHERVKQQRLDWRQLTMAQVEQLATEALEHLAPHFVHRLLYSSSRYAYIYRKLTQIIEQTAHAIRLQASRSSFETKLVEASFGIEGEQDAMPPITIDLGEGHQMLIRGRIDRVDRAEIDGETYVRIIDYKSSDRELAFDDVYYGLSLQMVTYLDALVTNATTWNSGKPVHPAGMFYFHVHNPMLKGEELKEEVMYGTDWLKQYKLSGYAIDDVAIVEQMDEGVSKGSDVLPVRLKKDGSFYAYSKVIGLEEMDILRQFSRKKHEEAGRAIFEGVTTVEPTQKEERLPCTFCNYRAICQFDPTDAASEKKIVSPLDDDATLQKMREEIDSNDTD